MDHRKSKKEKKDYLSKMILYGQYYFYNEKGNKFTVLLDKKKKQTDSREAS